MQRFFQQLVSKIWGRLADSTWKPLKNYGTAWFIRLYGVDLSQAVETDYRAYPTFNAFFTRRLKPGARILATEPGVVLSPVDGSVSACGAIQQDQIFQAKGHHYPLNALLADQPFAKQFESGIFLTAYLSPKDYHRVHMPFSGKLLSMHFVPGTLFPVNPRSVAKTPQLFARNERVILYFETEAGPMAVIFVGALIVGSMVLKHHGEANSSDGKVRSWDYRDAPQPVAQGDELGYFKLGSTVLVLFGQEKIAWGSALKIGLDIKMGQSIGHRVEF